MRPGAGREPRRSWGGGQQCGAGKLALGSILGAGEGSRRVLEREGRAPPVLPDAALPGSAALLPIQGAQALPRPHRSRQAGTDLQLYHRILQQSPQRPTSRVLTSLP